MEASVARLHAMIIEHIQARDLNLARRTKLNADLKLLAEKKTAYVRLVQKQQTLERERDSDTAQAKNLETSLALLADEEAEYHHIEKTAGSYAEIRKRLDGLQLKKAEFVRLTGELGFATREIADLASRAEKQRTLIKGLDTDAVKKAELITRVRAGLGAAQEIVEDRLETAVSSRLAEINKRTGTLDTQQKHYREEREKILADQKTIREAGPDGTCPLCRQKLGSHFGSLDAEFTQKLQELTDKSVADLEKQEKLGKEKTTVESLKPLLGQIRTLSEKLRQKPVYESELADLEAKHTKKIHEHKAISRYYRTAGL